MQTPLRLHILETRPDLTTTKVRKPVTMPRLPWEPEITFADDRRETAPISKAIKRGRQKQELTINRRIAAIRAVYLESRESIA